ncbi:phosphate-starvation-inducible PsiE family protein [Pseudoramibacter sp.]|jgi:phosphate starvation-inducible membrane PsiE|uniref:phosphate-starvation-inducible PsiE family protein n=1 Tax=Pseudoramibacter sp. TaxID=2034862 RepID=UPI0025D7427F|nr:phosphate-starvation-inducible PsiE family protein [Pseudoramibacter sp.]MCH4071344.1 phosphate-starvation-inducible PsiE family protein [Pseudoramibacter sp.]MCH4105112.1 phosphate-starvation-inducible PsiE family protein [Pseudoramibacter sp.]
MNQIKKRATDFFEVALKIVELGIALLLLIFIAINLVSLFGHVHVDASLTDSFKHLQHYLELSLNLIICTEFIRMIYAHTMEAVLEALIFAIARGMIAGHMDGVQTLLYVAAIFVLMVIRKNTS